MVRTVHCTFHVRHWTIILLAVCTLEVTTGAPAHADPKPRSALRHAYDGVRSRITPVVRRIRGKATLLADRIERTLPRRLRGSFAWTRDASPLAAGAYAMKKFGQDRSFLLWYGAGSQVATRIGLPAAASLGLVSPTVATALYLGSTLVDFSVLAVRQHATRSDRGASFASTLRSIGREYRETVSHRREVNRRYMRRYGHRSLAHRAGPPTDATNPLAQVGAALAHPSQL